MKGLCQRDKRNTTGCVGVSISRANRREGVRHYYQASVAGTKRRFCIETLGASEAYRRALKARADYETERSAS